MKINGLMGSEIMENFHAPCPHLHGSPHYDRRRWRADGVEIAVKSSFGEEAGRGLKGHLQEGRYAGLASLYMYM